MLDDLTRQRHEGQRMLSRSVARAGALRPEPRQRDAAAAVHALGFPELYGLLVVDRGWKPERYARWLEQTLIGETADEGGRPLIVVGGVRQPDATRADTGRRT